MVPTTEGVMSSAKQDGRFLLSQKLSVPQRDLETACSTRQRQAHRGQNRLQQTSMDNLPNKISITNRLFATISLLPVGRGLNTREVGVEFRGGRRPLARDVEYSWLIIISQQLSRVRELRLTKP